MLEAYDLKQFYSIPKPKHYVWLMRDIGLPVPTSWLGFVQRLHLTDTAGSEVQVSTVRTLYASDISLFEPSSPVTARVWRVNSL